jgi:hypothetical protein
MRRGEAASSVTEGEGELVRDNFKAFASTVDATGGNFPVL